MGVGCSDGTFPYAPPGSQRIAGTPTPALGLAPAAGTIRVRQTFGSPNRVGPALGQAAEGFHLAHFGIL